MASINCQGMRESARSDLWRRSHLEGYLCRGRLEKLNDDENGNAGMKSAERTPSDAMHQALGEFLTDMGRVEFRMLLLMDSSTMRRSKRCSTSIPGEPSRTRSTSSRNGVTSEGCPTSTNRRCKGFTSNWMNSGRYETSWFMVRLGKEPFKGKPRQPYRVGLVKKISNIWTNSSAPNMVRTSLTFNTSATRPSAAQKSAKT